MYIGVIDYLTVEIVQKMRTGPFIAGVLSVDPTAQVVSKLEGSANVQKSMAAMQDMLQAHPEVNLVYGANADHALGALAALENAGRGKAVNGKPLTEIVIGTDATEGELAKLYDPNSAFKITQGLQPAVNAKAEMDLLAKMIAGIPARRRVDPDRHLQQVHQLLADPDRGCPEVRDRAVFLHGRPEEPGREVIARRFSGSNHTVRRGSRRSGGSLCSDRESHSCRQTPHWRRAGSAGR